MMSQLVEYIRRLVDISSVTGSEHEVASFLEKDLRRRGFSVTLQDVVDGRQNVYGRGSCDAKGVLAAMVFAAVALREQSIEDVGLLFVVGEEVDSVGALAANRLPARAAYGGVGGAPRT